MPDPKQQIAEAMQRAYGKVAAEMPDVKPVSVSEASFPTPPGPPGPPSDAPGGGAAGPTRQPFVNPDPADALRRAELAAAQPETPTAAPTTAMDVLAERTGRARSNANLRRGRATAAAVEEPPAEVAAPVETPEPTAQDVEDA